MISDASTVQVQVTNTVVGYELGQVVSVPCDSEGTPLAFEWRRRLKDGACETLTPAPQAKKRSSKSAPGDDEL